MARNKKTAAPEAPKLKVGDRVNIIAGSKAGQHDAIVEIDSEDGDIRLAGFGWHKATEVELLEGKVEPEPEAKPPSRRKQDAAAKAAADAEAGAPPLSDNGKHRGTVDGKDAIIDGTVPPSNGPMIKPPLEDLVHSLARAKVILQKATLVKKRSSEEYNDALGQYNAIADEIVQHYGEVEQLGLNFTASQTEEEDEEYEPTLTNSGPE